MFKKQKWMVLYSPIIPNPVGSFWGGSADEGPKKPPKRASGHFTARWVWWFYSPHGFSWPGSPLNRGIWVNMDTLSFLVPLPIAPWLPNHWKIYILYSARPPTTPVCWDWREGDVVLVIALAGQRHLASRLWSKYPKDGRVGLNMVYTYTPKKPWTMITPGFFTANMVYTHQNSW